MSNGYSISKWDSAAEINADLLNLTSQPIWCVSDEYLKEILDNYYGKKCVKSKALYDEAKQYIPNGVQHNLAFNSPFPLCFEKAVGAYLYDADGNRYLDFLQAGGPTILGSNYPIVRAEVEKLLNSCGPVTGLFHEAELLLAREINKHMPAVEMFRMLGSGTEAVMGAVRAARLYTKKKNVVKVGGSYHGWSDHMVFGQKVPGSGRLESHGIPGRTTSLTREVSPNDLKKLEHCLMFNKLRGGTACVILEPVGPESGTRPIDFDYNKGVRELCDKYKCLLIFDEVVTGFRLGLGGAQGYFGVKPDLTIFGKIIAGGYPAAGGIGGSREIINNTLAAGLQSGSKKAYIGGTLAANPLSSLAGYYTIKEIERTNACEKAGIAGDKLTAGIKALIKKYELPFVCFNQGSIVHLECSGAMAFDVSSPVKIASLLKLLKQKDNVMRRKVAMERMGAAYMANGIVTLAGSRLYTSMADTDEVVAEALAKFENVFKHVVKGINIEEK
ncbi:MAG: aminotransferase class III-fold pyridoxal phosphate-dependent enzyme [Clostridiales bacterium]|jgi:glutamate-1-semialdehyde 2,1-aminomutase|nr:aminotransferase class III-fold pyridoxal phosphate-dependent enzyme [Clostridiales bacterium]